MLTLATDFFDGCIVLVGSSLKKFEAAIFCCAMFVRIANFFPKYCVKKFQNSSFQITTIGGIKNEGMTDIFKVVMRRLPHKNHPIY
jgi:hypothetical protein